MSELRKILRKPGVRGATGLSDAQVSRKANDPEDDFPAPVQIGANSTGWFEDEIIQWQEGRPRVVGDGKPHLVPHYNRSAKSAPQASETATTDEPKPEAA